MLVEVKIVQDEGRDVDSKERRVVHVETHSRRNEAFLVQKTDDVLEGDAVTFNIPNGGRLVINTPLTSEDVVYDPEQAAAVRPSQQQNREDRADKASLDEIAKQKQIDADKAKELAEADRSRREEESKSLDQKVEEQRRAEAARGGAAPVTGTVHSGQPQAVGAANKPNNPAANTPNPSNPSTPAQTPPQQKK